MPSVTYIIYYYAWKTKEMFITLFNMITCTDNIKTESNLSNRLNFTKLY